MNLKKTDSEQLSFSFWAGYVLFDTYEINYSTRLYDLSIEEVFNFVKQKGFGKNNSGLFEIIDDEKVYGIYNLEKIEFYDFEMCSKNLFLSKILNFITENFKSQSSNDNDLSALINIVEKKLEKHVKYYDIFMFNKNPLPKMKIPMRYEFFQSYFLFSENFKKYLHIEVAND
ncbi:MAG: hypothetical protein MUF43_13165 [Flavobacterium sp.]|jgi:hypothetical protein|nr:hypothetical protein [Hydrotalea sp.]MCU0351756.1 hypothetical protein [Flavobacterium sp.]